MKGGVAMLVDAFLRAARGELKPRGDLILCVLADEENGGDFGAKFLVEEHADLFEGVRHALGEFGGARVPLGGASFYPIQVAEKQICWLRGRVRGPGGHGAIGVKGSAMGRLGRVLAKLDRGRLPVHVTPVTHAWISAMAEALPRPQSLVLRSLLDPRLAELTLRAPTEQLRLLERALRNTVSATIVRGGEKINVIPAEVELELDGRALPGYGPDDLIAEVRALVGDDLELELVRHDATPAEPDLSQLPLLSGILRELDAGRRAGADAPDRRHGRPLPRPDRDPDVRLPAARPAGRLRVHEADPRGGRARAGRRGALRRGGDRARGRAVRRVRLLVLGGTKFLGRHVVDAALAGGHEVTIFTRGRTNPELYPEAEHLVGDRDGGLAALAGRSWDGVVDTSGYVPRVVRQSAELLRDAVERYVFVSSVSVYADFSRPISEETPVAELEDPASEDVEADYGALKAACERVVEEAFGDRATSVRAGLIVGPHDPTDRFTYWPRRLAAGGDVLAPGSPDAPVQFVDARDLAAWLLRLAEQGPGGAFNATGPAEPLTFGELLERATAAIGSDANLVWTDEQRIVDAGVQPWTELPLWIPGDEYAGMEQADTSRARAAGLAFRPLEETVRDTLAWSLEAGEQRPTLTREREAEILAGAK